jgi:CheY-like chemotaxis protein
MPSVLIVEDLPKWANMFSQGLRDRGYQVDTAPTVQGSIGKLHTTKFDVAIINLNLLTDDDHLAEGVLAEIVRCSPLTPCIIVSGRPNEVIAMVGRYQHQIYEMLLKGDKPQAFNLVRLFNLVDAAIRDRAPVCELLDVLDDCLSDDEFESVKQEMPDYYKYFRLQPPEDPAGNSKRQKLGYMIAVLHHSGLNSVCDLRDAVMSVRPNDGQLKDTLNRILPPGSRPAPQALDAKTKAEVERFVKESDLVAALEKLLGINWRHRDTVQLRGRLNDLYLRERRGEITFDEGRAERARIARAILEIISS